MVVFDFIRYKNFLASGNYWTKINFNDTSNTLIVGMNGSGKSTFLDALCFVLFGKSFREINKPKLVNTINQKDCLVEIEFTSNGSRYRVVRGMKPNIFEIYKDGELLNKDASSRDYQAVLERSILKFNFKSFTQIVIIGSASFKPFMKLTPADRREVIEDILDINIFSVMNSVIKNKITDSKVQIADTKNKHELVQHKYNLEKKYIDSLKQDNEGKIEQSKGEIEFYTSNIDEIQKEIDKLLEEVQSYQSLVSSKSTVEERLGKLRNIEYAIDGKLKKRRTELSFFNQNNECPVCGQNIDYSFKNDKIIKLQKDIDDISEGFNQLKDKLEEERKSLNDIELAQKYVHNLQVKISSHNSSISETRKYIKKVQNTIEELTKQSTVIQDESNLDKIGLELEEVSKSLNDLIEKRSYYDAAYGLLKDSGVKTKIIKQYIPIINKFVNKYLNALDFFINFNLDETFKETIKSRHRDDFGYNNFSEGEKAKINLALLFAWREVAKIKNSTNTNILILDEIFDSSLDDDGIECLLNILHTMEKINIHVISHKGDILIDKFDKVVKFEKVKNFSKMKIM